MRKRGRERDIKSKRERERARKSREIMVLRPNKFYALKRQLLIADGMPRFRHLFLKKNDSYLCNYYILQKKKEFEFPKMML